MNLFKKLNYNGFFPFNWEFIVDGGRGRCVEMGPIFFFFRFGYLAAEIVWEGPKTSSGEAMLANN